MSGRDVKAIAVALAAAGLLAVPAAAQASEVEAAVECPQFGTGNHVTAGDDRFAQTFAAPATGRLLYSFINITKNAPDGPGPYIFRLATTASGVPTNEVLGTATVPESAVPGGSINLPTRADFTSFPVVTAGQEYALVVTRPGAGPNGLRLNSRTGTGCPGSLFRSTGQAGAFADLGYDLVFRALIDTPAVLKLGKHPRKKTDRERATFKFSADEKSVSFRCSLDKFKKCSSPRKYEDLDPGKHRFRVFARDDVGNVSPTAAFKWKVLED